VGHVLSGARGALIDLQSNKKMPRGQEAKKRIHPKNIVPVSPSPSTAVGVEGEGLGREGRGPPFFACQRCGEKWRLQTSARRTAERPPRGSHRCSDHFLIQE